MSVEKHSSHLFWIILISLTLVFSGCSYIPWNKDEDDLAFEEDFPFDEEEELADADEGMEMESEEPPATSEGKEDLFPEGDSDFEEVDNFENLETEKGTEEVRRAFAARDGGR